MSSDSSYTTPELRALTEAGISLTSELSLEKVLQKVVEVARELVGAKYAALSVLNSAGKVERFFTSGISAEQRAKIGALPQGRGLLGVILKEGSTLRLDDISKDPRSYGFPPHHPEMHSLLGLPLVWAGRVIGNLYLTEKEAGFSERDEEIVRLLATQAAVAVRNAELHAQLDSLARLEERDRIAMDLHDGVIQSIYAVGLQLEDVAERLEDSPASARSRIEATINSLNGVIKDIRSYIFDLRPSLSSVDDLPSAIEQLAAQLQVNTLIDTEVNAEGVLNGRLNAEQALGLYHIAQEALNNIGKHSKASIAHVTISSDSRSVRLQISDNGEGLPPEERQHEGQGMRNMRDRANAIGANLAIESRPRKGTTIRVTMPLDNESERRDG